MPSSAPTWRTRSTCRKRVSDVATVAERVAKGVALLDERHPEWACQVDVEALDIQSHRLCVVGQVFGGWSQGLIEVYGDIDSEDTEGHGFDGYNVRGRAQYESDCAGLTAEWKRVILARREGTGGA